MKYLHDGVIKDSFLRLQQVQPGGKKGLERTSALMYFLAFESLTKKSKVSPPFDLDPETPNGKRGRDVLTVEYQRLVQVGTVGLQPCHVINLGEVKTGFPNPENRISANFLTVPLKDATTCGQKYEYPSRPKPLLLLGQEATGLTWGINRHPAWQENLPSFFEGRKTSTPFHDLAIFVLRKERIVDSIRPLQVVLLSGLSERFSPEFCDYWGSRLSLEKPYMRAISNAYQSLSPKLFDNLDWLGHRTKEDRLAIYAARIDYLEGLLNVRGIPYSESE